MRVSDPTQDRSQRNINELEYVDGYIYANIWLDFDDSNCHVNFLIKIFFSSSRYQDEIIKIDPSDGSIVKRYDLTNLYPKDKRIQEADCLNGIAYNSTSREFILTGKKWPFYYAVLLEDSPSASFSSEL